jgi:Spy/CpxP family protein refolding chaperone
MKYHREKLALKRLATLTAAATAAFLMLPTLTMAQRGSGRAPLAGADRARERGVAEHERQLRVMMNSKEPKEPSNQAQLQAIIEQTREDFDRIQVVNREIVRALVSKDGLDYKNIAEMTAEIRKRAKRLKDYTNLPPPEEEQPVRKQQGEIGQEKIKSALLLLKEHILSFVMNPLFQSSNLIDVKLGAKASSDLETIIELSGQIRKSAEKMGKTSVR